MDENNFNHGNIKTTNISSEMPMRMCCNAKPAESIPEKKPEK